MSYGREYPKAKLLWNTYSIGEKLLWFVFRVWPLRIIGKKLVKEIDAMNAIREDENRCADEEDSESYLNKIEYPRIFHPNPKAAIIFEVKLAGPIHRITVSGVIET